MAHNNLTALTHIHSKIGSPITRITWRQWTQIMTPFQSQDFIASSTPSTLKQKPAKDKQNPKAIRILRPSSSYLPWSETSAWKYLGIVPKWGTRLFHRSWIRKGLRWTICSKCSLIINISWIVSKNLKFWSNDFLNSAWWPPDKKACHNKSWEIPCRPS